MHINWYVGLKRLSYAFLILVWVIGLAIVHDSGAAQIGYAVGMLLIFTFGYVLLFLLLAWAVRGFFVSKENPREG